MKVSIWYLCAIVVFWSSAIVAFIAAWFWDRHIPTESIILTIIGMVFLTIDFVKQSDIKYSLFNGILAVIYTTTFFGRFFS